MREIKFRYWNEYLKTWECTEYMVGNKGFIKIRNVIPCQYTGLKDKNGKEIYEGDIVTFRGNQYPVEYSERWATFMPLDREEAEGECEVIGNIYENPELLK